MWQMGGCLLKSAPVASALRSVACTAVSSQGASAVSVENRQEREVIWQGHRVRRLVGTHGVHDFSGVRLSYVNGIYNLEQTCARAASRLSQLHGHAKVAYVYHPSVDFWSDVRRATRYFVTRDCHQAQASAKALADLWRQMLSEMSFEVQKPRILHFAHSFGVVITQLAAREFEHASLLDLRLFGSPWLVPSRPFHGVRQIVTASDPVTWLTHLQFYRRHIEGTLENVPCQLPEKDEKGSWRERHHLFGLAYKEVIEKMAQDFMGERAPGGHWNYESSRGWGMDDRMSASA